MCGPSWSYCHQLVSSWRVGRVLRCQETPTSGKEQQVRPPHLPQAPAPSKVKGCFSNVPRLLSLLSFAHYGMPVAMVTRKKGGTGAGEDSQNPASPTAFLLSPDTSAHASPTMPDSPTCTPLGRPLPLASSCAIPSGYSWPNPALPQPASALHLSLSQPPFHSLTVSCAHHSSPSAAQVPPGQPGTGLTHAPL